MECLTGCLSAIAGEARNSLLSKAEEHIGYLINYNENINSLKAARDELDAKRTDANRFVDDANNTLHQDVASTVSLWLFEADELHQEAQHVVLPNSRSWLKPWSRYSSSKNAWELTQKINKQVQKAPDFGTTFNRPPTGLAAKFDLTGFTDFESRLSSVNDIWEALKDEKVSMCSICGMGGVGKTTLAKKLVQRVEAHKLFDNVAMVTVSQNPEPVKIRSEIVSCLRWKFSSKKLETSYKLLERLMSSNKRILLILDDVWEELDFEEIGIPKSRVKILLTSRREDVCKRMGSEPNIPIKKVKDKEAWDMFREIASEPIEKWQMHDIARKIAGECDGLPIVIVTIATALKFEAKATWNDSLLKLRKSNLLGISGMEKVYSRIQLSYDLLKDKEAQFCFRLCCLFPEDVDIPVDYITYYAKGLQVLEDVNSMEESRNRVESIIDKLKNSFLLLDGNKDDSVRMHDILRDFAIWISSKDKNPYLVRCEEVIKKWPERKQCENCSAISFWCRQIKEYPVDLAWPKLELVQILGDDSEVGLPIGFFEGMTELKVLALQVKSKLEPITMLKKLRTLIIQETSYKWAAIEPLKIGDVLSHGVLKNLEILQISSRRPCHDFPKEIGLLCNLRSLVVDGMNVRYIPPGILSELVNLEELILPSEFMSWGCKEREGERVNASLNEIESLPLTRLSITVPTGFNLSEKLTKNLKRFKVFLSNRIFFNVGFDSRSKAALMVSDVDASQLTGIWISSLQRRCESLKLDEVKNLENVHHEVYINSQLKDLKIWYCKEMEYMVDGRAECIPSTCFSQVKYLSLEGLENLKEIWQGFRNLSEIFIVECPKLKYVFTLTVARELRQLQEMIILFCDGIEEIIHDARNQIGEETIAGVVFPRLKSLVLIRMHNLGMLYDGRYAIELPSLEELKISRCKKMEGLSRGLFNAPRLKKVVINRIKYRVGEEDANAIVKKVFTESQTL